MQKTILITGATDGIGLETAKLLYAQGHQVLLHGRNPEKLEQAEKSLSVLSGQATIGTYLADLSNMSEVEAFANAITQAHTRLDVIINNAGILKAATPITEVGLDIRFVVNTLSPYLLTRRLLPLLGSSGRVINLSSAAQAPVDPQAITGQVKLDDMAAYAQSKLAITMWTRTMAKQNPDGPVFVAVNPGSLLASKMVKEGFGVAGNDLSIGAEILVRAALSEEFASATGQYFDNDSGRFASPHRDGLDDKKSAEIVRVIETVLDELS